MYASCVELIDMHAQSVLAMSVLMIQEARPPVFFRWSATHLGAFVFFAALSAVVGAFGTLKASGGSSGIGRSSSTQ